MKSFLVLIISLSTSGLACKKIPVETDCSRIYESRVRLKITYHTGRINEIIPVAVLVDGFDYRSAFGYFNSTNNKDGKTISIISFVCQKVCKECETDWAVIEIPAVYNFSSNKKGTYYLKFINNNSKNVIDTIVIN